MSLLRPFLCLFVGAALCARAVPDHLMPPAFVERTSPQFRLPATSDVTFTLRDYWDHEVAHGTAQASNGFATITSSALAPGWYELTAVAGESCIRHPFAILLEGPAAPLSANQRIGIDAASAWLVSNEDLRPALARLLRQAGIAWVRERISWSDTQPSPDHFDWSRYQSTIDTLAAEGVHISQLWHDSPRWTRPNNDGPFSPVDLRDVYRWTRAAAAHFGNHIDAWEVWNEMELPNFWLDGGDRYAALLKAAFWGIKDGSPQALVVSGALATNPPDHFARNLYASHALDYADRFNWHCYTAPTSYTGALVDHRSLQQAAAAPFRPSWITEAGILISGSEGPDHRLLDAAGRRAQARFAAQSVIASLAAGNERHFFFILVDFLENGVQFGVLQPDLAPYPAFVALSAAAHLLGESTYLGAWLAPAGVQAHAFATPAGTVLALWADSAQTITLPCPARNATVADFFGARHPLVASDGSLSLAIGPEVTYLLEPDPSLLAQLIPAPPAPPSAPASCTSRIVLAGSAALPVAKENNTYRLGAPTDPVPFHVEVYNFDSKHSALGEFTITAPAGWTVEPATIICTVEPMGRFTASANLIPIDIQDTLVHAVTVTGHFGEESVAPSVSYFQRDLTQIPPTRTLTLPWLPAAHWKPEVSPIGSVEVSDVEAGLHINAHFQGSGDRWAYPVLSLDPALNLADFDGIAFTLQADAPTPNSWVRLMLLEPDGSTYMVGTQEFDARRPVVFRFDAMQHMNFSPTDANGHLDLDSIIQVKLGLNTPGDTMSFTITDLRAVKFTTADQP